MYGEDLLSEESKELMFTPHHRGKSTGGGYGYGWDIQEVRFDDGLASVRAVGHAGDAPGFLGYIGRFIEEEHLIVFLTNTNALGVGNMRQVVLPILRILHDLPYDRPKVSVARALLPTIRDAGVAAGIEYYRRLKQSEPDNYAFEEGKLNTLGYQLLQQGRVRDAIDIFRLNVGEYPTGYNTYDSLAEAYMAGGFVVDAIANYRKSLELNPDNTNAVDMLQKLRAAP